MHRHDVSATVDIYTPAPSSLACRLLAASMPLSPGCWHPFAGMTKTERAVALTSQGAVCETADCGACTKRGSKQVDVSCMVTAAAVGAGAACAAEAIGCNAGRAAAALPVLGATPLPCATELEGAVAGVGSVAAGGEPSHGESECRVRPPLCAGLASILAGIAAAALLPALTASHRVAPLCMTVAAACVALARATPLLATVLPGAPC